jgi:phage-related minor tail protein
MLRQTGQHIQLIEDKRDAAILALGEIGEEDEARKALAVLYEENADRAIQKIKDKAKEKDDKANDDKMKRWQQLNDFMKDGFEDALATMVLDGEFSFKTLAESFKREFVKKGIEQAMSGVWDNLPGALSSLATIFSGTGLTASDTNIVNTGTSTPVSSYPIHKGSANGGPVSRGPILVGERGPELLMLDRSGFVANNASLAKMGGGGGGALSVTVINNTGQESSTTEKDGPDGGRSIEVMIGKAVSSNIARGGNVDQAIRNSYGVNRVGRHGI